MTLEPVATKTAAEILAEHGETPVSAQESEELFGPIPSDGEHQAGMALARRSHHRQFLTPCGVM